MRTKVENSMQYKNVDDFFLSIQILVGRVIQYSLFLFVDDKIKQSTHTN